MVEVVLIVARVPLTAPRTTEVAATAEELRGRQRLNSIGRDRKHSKRAPSLEYAVEPSRSLGLLVLGVAVVTLLRAP